MNSFEDNPKSIMGRRKGTGNQSVALGVLLDHFKVNDEILVPFKFLEKHNLLSEREDDDSSHYNEEDIWP